MPVSGTTAAAFLAFDQFHIVKLTGLSPDHIRGAARRMSRDREDIKHNTALNRICKVLGFNGGFAGYKKEWPRLEQFLSQQGLELDGLTQFDSPYPIHITPTQIADRLFKSGKAIPFRVFTGTGPGWHDLLQAASHTDGLEPHYRFRLLGGHDRALSPQILEELARTEPEATFTISDGNTELTIGDAPSASNLLGGQLLQFADAADEPATVTAYSTQTAGMPDCDDPETCLAQAGVLRQTIQQMDRGWVDILPYNERLAFLRDWTGRSTFVFNGMKEKTFQHTLHAPFLKNADMSKSDDLYHFGRWLYFEYTGWDAADRHASELWYYQQGGKPQQHPGGEKLLKRYLTWDGQYSPPSKTAPLADGFHHVQTDTGALAVSDLITTGAFRDFMLRQNPEYAAYRPGRPEQDDWEISNRADDNPDLPAAATWYDAQAYATHISKTRGLPVRLPTEAEYMAITGDFWPDLPTTNGVATDRGDGNRSLFPQHSVVAARRDDPENWGTGFRIQQQPQAYQNQDMAGWPFFQTTSDGVRCIRACDVGELLLKPGAVINTLHLGAICAASEHVYDMHPSNFGTRRKPDWNARVWAEREHVPANFNGAWKGWRFCFRLVYDLPDSGASRS